MSKPVCTLREVTLVKEVYDLLASTTHNGFPVIGDDGHLRGFILRKTLCELMVLKAFSTPSLPMAISSSTLGTTATLSSQVPLSSQASAFTSALAPASSSSAAAAAAAAVAMVGNNNNNGMTSPLPSSSAAAAYYRNNNVNIDHGDVDGDGMEGVISPEEDDNDGSGNGRGDIGRGGGSSGGGGFNGSSTFFEETDTNLIALVPGASIFYETLEKSYPNYHTIQDVSLSSSEMTVSATPLLYFYFFFFYFFFFFFFFFLL